MFKLTSFIPSASKFLLRNAKAFPKQTFPVSYNLLCLQKSNFATKPKKSLLDTALDQSPKVSELMLRAKELIISQEHEESIEVYNNIIEEYQTASGKSILSTYDQLVLAEMYYTRGTLLFKEECNGMKSIEDFQTAIGMLESLEESEERNNLLMDAYLYRAEAYETLGNANVTIRAFELALEKAHHFKNLALLSEIHINLGTYLETLGEEYCDKALENFKKSVEYVKHLHGEAEDIAIDCYESYGKALYHHGKFEEAVPILKKAIALHDKKTYIWDLEKLSKGKVLYVLLINSKLKSGKLEEASAVIDRFCKFNVEFQESPLRVKNETNCLLSQGVHLMLQKLKKLGLTQEEVKLYLTALEYEDSLNERHTLLSNITSAFDKLKKYDQVIEYGEKALSTKPSHVDARAEEHLRHLVETAYISKKGHGHNHGHTHGPNCGHNHGHGKEKHHV